MQYQPYLISNFATGLDRERQPWLLPDDAQFELLDGFVYRGVWQKRQGYSQFATGEKSGSAYTESRMVHRISNFATVGAINSSNQTYTATLTVPANMPISRGSVVVSGTTPPQSFTDNGLGAFTSGGATGTINYVTGAMSITLPTAPTAGSVTVGYDLYQGFPVMGVMNFFTQQAVRQLIVADTTYVNRYNPSTNRLEDISPTTLLTGDETNFFSWTNYLDPNALQRLLFVNYKDPIQQYSGSTVTVYPVFTESIPLTGVASGVLGDGTAGPYTINTPANTGILTSTLFINSGAQQVNDDGFGILEGNGTGTVNYLSGTIVVTFTLALVVGAAIDLTYTQLNTPIKTCRHIFQFKDRAVLLSIIENNNVQKGLRIRVSGTGQFCDVFTQDAIGAGLIDIPDQTFIQSADFNRDDLVIFTEDSTWILKYTSNDAIPFVLNKIDDSRGSQAPYGTITYLNRTNAVSPIGFIITDGYSVERVDNNIPEYSFNNINQDRFFQCFAGSVNIDRDHYLIHPSPGVDISDVILVTNYEEDNYAEYRIPLSCMGEFIGGEDVTWNDLLKYNTWFELAEVYSNWNAFAFSKGAPFAIGGGHHGEITALNESQGEDYPVKIRNITIIDDQTLEITTDFQSWVLGDIIFLAGISGMVEANNKQGAITLVSSHYVFRINITTVGFSVYSQNGTASKVIVFSSTTKKFNPFAQNDQKVRCGWVYFYVSTSGTDLTDNKVITGASNSNPAILTVPGHGYITGTKIYVNGAQGITQLNGLYYSITVVDSNHISLNGVDATGFGVWTSGGFTSTPANAKIQVTCIVNDADPIQLDNFDVEPYEINLSNNQAENGIKKWYKLWVNQIGRFIQLKFDNSQAGAKIEIHALMPGFAGLGRLI